MVSRSAVNTPREAFGLRGIPTVIPAHWLTPLVEDIHRLADLVGMRFVVDDQKVKNFTPPIVFPLVKPATFGGRRPYTPLKSCRRLPSRPAKGGEL